MYEWTRLVVFLNKYIPSTSTKYKYILFTELCTVKIASFQSFWLYEIFYRDNRYYIDRWR